MKIISHRGNLFGSNLDRENNPIYLEEAISEGFDVELDLWVKNTDCYFGHDEPQYHVDISWLEEHKDLIWIHCKNREALEKMSASSIDFNYFYHEQDPYTLTSKGIGWVLVGQLPYSKSVIVLPENFNCNTEIIKTSFGICTDKPLFYREIT